MKTIGINMRYTIRNDENYKTYEKILEKELQAQRNYWNNYQNADDL